MFELEEVSYSKLVTDILYRRKIREFRDRFDELRDPRILYVTDVVSCSHKRFFRLNYPELTLRFEPPLLLGDLLHVGLEEVLREEGYSVEVEVERDFEVDGVEYRLKGRVDAVGEKGVVEIKTGRAGQSLPHQHHLLQVQVYMHMLDVDQGVLVYVTPDRLVEYLVRRGPLNLKELIRETVEDTAHPRWEWECRYCSYSRLCPFRAEV